MTEESTPEPSAKPESDMSVAEAKKKVSGAPKDKIIIHPFPKVVLLWPVMLASLLFYFLGGGVSDEAIVDPSALGWWWMVIFFFNMLIHTFDFGRTNFVATLAVMGVGFLGLWVWDLQSDIEIYGKIYAFFEDKELAMHANFYAMMAGVLAVLMVMAFITTRFNYWVLSPNQLTHKHGLLGDERHYPTLNMAVEKEIPDVFEWALFGSGRLIFKPGTGSDQHKTLVVENVFRVNKLERHVREFLGIVKVDEDRRR
ncbi:MAG: hypothetical protein ACYTDT_02960 [Planctomycetota bacterium]|jgi:hypothetical protein